MNSFLEINKNTHKNWKELIALAKTIPLTEIRENEENVKIFFPNSSAKKKYINLSEMYGKMFKNK